MAKFDKEKHIATFESKGWKNLGFYKWELYGITYFYAGSIDLSSSIIASAVGLSGYSGTIRDLLIADNDAFFPPLSYRKGSTGSGSIMNLKNLEESGIDSYRETMLAQKNIFATKDNSVVGFMSFRHDLESPYYFAQVLKEGDVINYITTIIVNKQFRRLGIASGLYTYVENFLPPSAHGNCVATRTWKENEEHTKLLSNRGYILTCVLPKERHYDGKEDDTVYYAKRVVTPQENPKIYL